MLNIEIAAEKIFSPFGFPVTNTLLTSWVVLVLLGGWALWVGTRMKALPGGLQNIMELAVERLLEVMGGVFGSREIAERYLPVTATIFLFVLLSNWFGIMPGVGSVGIIEIKDGKEALVPLFRSTASDLNFTLALALIAMIAVNVFGVSAIGWKTHFSKFFNFKSPMLFGVGLLELISEFAKIISFSFRLFGNVFAGEVLLLITGFLVPYAIPVPFLGLELFVGFIQALVFAMLTMVFIAVAISHEHKPAINN